MTAPPWSPRCEPRDRLAALDDDLIDLLDEADPGWATAAWLWRLNRECSATAAGYDVARSVHRALRPGASDGDLVVAAMHQRFNAAQLQSIPRALAAGAQPVELLVLGVHGWNCDGEDLTVCEGGDLRRRMEDAVRLAQAGASAWLRGYTARLVDRWRERQGHGIDAPTGPRSRPLRGGGP